MSDAAKSFAQKRLELWGTGLAWVRRARRLQNAINILCVFGGGLLAVIGGGMDGPLVAESGDGLLTVKGVCVWLGGALVFVGSILLLILQDEAPALLQKAGELESAAQTFLSERDQLLASAAEADRIDKRRLALLDMGKSMLEAAESVILIDGSALEQAVDGMLRTARKHLIEAIDFDKGEYWAISIFKAEAEQMRRIVTLRDDPQDEQVEGRSWRRGDGFVGMAWQRGAEVIISDCNALEVAAAYWVPDELRRDNDQSRYRSIAVVPIRVGPEDRLWGVTAVSSDRIGRFRSAPGDRRGQNVDTVRLIAQIIELVTSAYARRNPGMLAELEKL